MHEEAENPGRPAADAAAGSRPETAVDYEHSAGLPALLERVGASLVVSTYQAGKVITIGTHAGRIVFGFHHFRKAMGLARTPTGLAVCTAREVWLLPAGPPALAHRVAPAGSHDVCFLARHAHFTDAVHGHDLAHAGGRLWLVNTLFNCLCTIEGDSSFVPRWRPPCVTGLAAGDRCHLNGLAADADGPRYVTLLGESDVVDGWRAGKATGGCLVDVRTSEVLVQGLCMPHSPRLHADALWLLNSGYGRLERYDPARRAVVPVAALPGYTRGLDCHAGLAFVGLSRIRDSAVFGGLPLDAHRADLRCGVAAVDLTTGAVVGTIVFKTGVEEIFDVAVLPGYRNPVIAGPCPDVDGGETIWLVPAQADALPLRSPTTTVP